MFKLKEKHMKGGKVNMCQGLRDWLEDERMKGKEEGIAEGKAVGLITGKAEGRAQGEIEESERMSKLIIILTEKNCQDDLIKAAKDIQYKKKLYEKFGL